MYMGTMATQGTPWRWEKTMTTRNLVRMTVITTRVSMTTALNITTEPGGSEVVFSRTSMENITQRYWIASEPFLMLPSSIIKYPIDKKEKEIYPFSSPKQQLETQAHAQIE